MSKSNILFYSRWSCIDFCFVKYRAGRLHFSIKQGSRSLVWFGRVGVDVYPYCFAWPIPCFPPLAVTTQLLSSSKAVSFKVLRARRSLEDLFVLQPQLIPTGLLPHSSRWYHIWPLCLSLRPYLRIRENLTALSLPTLAKVDARVPYTIVGCAPAHPIKQHYIAKPRTVRIVWLSITSIHVVILVHLCVDITSRTSGYIIKVDIVLNPKASRIPAYSRNIIMKSLFKVYWGE